MTIAPFDRIEYREISRTYTINGKGLLLSGGTYLTRIAHECLAYITELVSQFRLFDC